MRSARARSSSDAPGRARVDDPPVSPNEAMAALCYASAVSADSLVAVHAAIKRGATKREAAKRGFDMRLADCYEVHKSFPMTSKQSELFSNVWLACLRRGSPEGVPGWSRGSPEVVPGWLATLDTALKDVIFAASRASCCLCPDATRAQA